MAKNGMLNTAVRTNFLLFMALIFDGTQIYWRKTLTSGKKSSFFLSCAKLLTGLVRFRHSNDNNAIQGVGACSEILDKKRKMLVKNR